MVEHRPNVILAAECVYFEPAFPLLMQTLKDLFTLNEEAIVYFCFKKRRRADMQFVKMAKKAFQVDEIFDDDRPVFQRQALFLFSFKSRTGGKAAVAARTAGAVVAAQQQVGDQSVVNSGGIHATCDSYSRTTCKGIQAL